MKKTRRREDELDELRKREMKEGRIIDETEEEMTGNKAEIDGQENGSGGGAF